MRSLRGAILAVLVVSFGAALGGCDTIDSIELFDSKKKLPGDRKPVFPEGVPGVTQGIPQDLVKGYQQPEAAPDPAAAAAQASAEKAEPPKPAPKPRPKPRVATHPPPAPAAAQRPAAQPRQPAQAQAPWPEQQPQQQPQQQAPWPQQQAQPQPQTAPWPTAR